MKVYRMKGLTRSVAWVLIAALLTVNVSAQSTLSSAEKRLTRSISEKTIKRITTELSDDKFEGRGTLQRGGDASADWIAAQMKAMGLKPLGINGTYFQPVPLAAVEFSEQTSVKINGESLIFAKDWSTLTMLPDSTWNEQLVFVGHGVVSDEIGRNDLKDVDIKGKIVVWVQGPPRDKSTAEWAAFIDKASPVAFLLSKGAKAILPIANGREPMSQDFAINQTARRKIVPDDPAGAPSPIIPMMPIGNAAAEKLFAGTGMTAKAAMDAADSKDFRPMELPAKFEAVFREKRTRGKANNVIGYIEGSDPVLKSEAIVFTAHYDGFGLLNGQIYNAAADNAIGNGEMLAVAEAFSKMKVKPKRSLIFVSTTAEEYGLKGGSYFAQNPTWDITKIAANLNLDGIGTEIMGPVKNMIAFGGEYSSLGSMFNDVAKAYKITPIPDPIPEQNVFYRSDHYPFVARGVPALMLVGSPESTKEGFVKRFNQFEETKYHQPSDDVYQDWYWPGAKTVADMMGILGYRIAQSPTMPTWLPGNEFSNMKRGDKAK
ncbi:MAG TPA: M28 family peptidase [Pyrinomonadaceae bacterium]|nr:M28 family peptidase [Pyrinomonadaceae bacterium]